MPAPGDGVDDRCYAEGRIADPKPLRGLQVCTLDAAYGRCARLPLEDRLLLVTAYWRTNLTLGQLTLRLVVSKSAAKRMVDHLGPPLAVPPACGSARTRCSSSMAPSQSRAGKQHNRPSKQGPDRLEAPSPDRPPSHLPDGRVHPPGEHLGGGRSRECLRK